MALIKLLDLPSGSVLGLCDICSTIGPKGDRVLDTNPKPVFYCGTCEAYMCRECWGKWPLRVTAAARKVSRLLFQGGM